MQMLHVAMPLAPWVEQWLWPAPPVLSLSTEIALVSAYAAGWLAWSIGVCWYVRGVPPYPVLDTVWRDGSWLKLYGALIGLGLGCWAGERFLLR